MLRTCPSALPGTLGSHFWGLDGLTPHLPLEPRLPTLTLTDPEGPPFLVSPRPSLPNPRPFCCRPLQLVVGPAPPTRWTWRRKRRGLGCVRTAWGWPAGSCCCRKNQAVAFGGARATLLG